jgi:hypothetical protein
MSAIFVLLFWIAILVVVMRLLTWIAKRHPGLRNPAALVVETGAALAAFQVLANIGVLSSGMSGPRGPLIGQAILFGLVGGAAHFLAANIATSPHVLYPPFLALGVAALAWIWMPFLRWPVGIGMLVIGCAVSWKKSQSVRKSRMTGSGYETSRA